MASLTIGLLMISLLGLALADGFALTNSKNCELDRVSYLESSRRCHFFINRRSVGRIWFCAALEYCVASGCLPCDSPEWEEWRRISEKYCSRDLCDSRHVESNSFAAFTLPLQVTLHEMRRRKLFLQPSKNTSLSNLHGSDLLREQNHQNGFPLAPKTMALAVPATFLICCALLCPCFHAKRKSVAEHAVLAKEPSSMDSVSSFGPSSTSERTSSTPVRVPPSPSRFSLSVSPQLRRLGSMHLSTKQILNATQNFSPSLLIGEGGFGTVYKAELPDGQIVAIKRARKEHFSALRAEFSNEVELLAKIEHRNLVKLLGYNDKGNERVIITEYVPNGTLREHLDGQHGKVLDFNQRLEIAIDVAHALTYLHLYAERPIIHRDVKSSNILLTESMRAKVADFGFARTGPTDSDQTHVSTKVKGTAGYLDPEYLKTYQLTPKSDVFSFGILLVEILSGRRPVELKRPAEERITVRWAFKQYGEGNVRDIIDPLLEEVVDEEVLSKVLCLAFQCAAPTRSDRPAMKEVVEQLWEIRKDYVRSRRTV